MTWSTTIIVLNALFFAVMGLVALVQPARVTSTFGVAEIAADMRNEVRAVYGGFGLAIAALLVSTLVAEATRSGVLLSVAVALLGMAAGRVVGVCIDRAIGPMPCLFFFVELVLASSLLFVR